MTIPLTNLPKVELHRHLVGSLRLTTILDLAREYDLNLPAATLEELAPLVTIRPGEPKDLGFVLRKMAEITQRCFPSRAAVARIAYEMVADAWADGLVYLEIRFSPAYMTGQGGLTQSDLIEGVLRGLAIAAKDFPLRTGVVIGTNREMSLAAARETAALALSYAGRGMVVGVDLAGDEASSPARNLERVFTPLRADGRLGITVHAGEGLGAQSVADAIQYLGAQRIGHGVRAVEDPVVLELIRRENVTLETCPTSNVITGAVTSYAAHPLRYFLDEGIAATINSDDPSWFCVTLSDEYANSLEKMGLTRRHLAQAARNAALGAFLPLAEREALAEKIAPAYSGDEN